MEGWIKLHRNISNWKWITSPNHVLVFIQILVRANYKETSWRTETLAPGQLLTGIKQLRDVTGLSEMKVRRCLRDLASTSEITIKSTNKYSVITVLNWETYQESKPQATIKEQTDDTQTTTSKKVNKYKKVKKEKNNTSPLAFLFKPEDEIQAWLLEGSTKVQHSLVEMYSHHVLSEEIMTAYLWQSAKVKRKSDMFLVNWMKNKNTLGLGSRQVQKSKGRVTPGNPTGNPYKDENGVVLGELA